MQKTQRVLDFEKYVRERPGLIEKMVERTVEGLEAGFFRRTIEGVGEELEFGPKRLKDFSFNKRHAYFYVTVITTLVPALEGKLRYDEEDEALFQLEDSIQLTGLLPD